MSSPFVAEIRIFPFNFAPTGWAFCDGQIVPISQNTALFSLLGTTYGGDGKTNFALPNMQGNAPMHFGQGAGLSLRDLGESDGSPTVTLLSSEMPSHTHLVGVSSAVADTKVPDSTMILGRSAGGSVYEKPPGTPLSNLNSGSVGSSGGNQPHNNLMPYLVLNFCIALQGVFPPRS
jgi:microcystin-dependent protein